MDEPFDSDAAFEQLSAGLRDFDKQATTMNALALLSTKRKTRRVALDLLATAVDRLDEQEREKVEARAREIIDLLDR